MMMMMMVVCDTYSHFSFVSVDVGNVKQHAVKVRHCDIDGFGFVAGIEDIHKKMFNEKNVPKQLWVGRYVHQV